MASADLTTLRGSNIAILHIVNAVATKNYGLSANLAQAFPYSDIYGDRVPLYTLNRARVGSRDTVGDIKIYQDGGNPFIIALISHYAPGDPTDSDPIKQANIKTTTDGHYSAGLKEDTLNNRVTKLNECIKKLVATLPHLPINYLFVPAGTGCGLKGEVWERRYLPLFDKLAKACAQRNINFIMSERKREQHPAVPSKTREWHPPSSAPPENNIIYLDHNEDQQQQQQQELHLQLHQQEQQHLLQAQQLLQQGNSTSPLQEVDSQALQEVLITLEQQKPPHQRKDAKKRPREDESHRANKKHKTHQIQ